MLDPVASRPPALPHDPTLIPDVVVEEEVFGSRRGFRAVSRRRLALGAAAVSLFSVALHDLPATAVTVKAETRPAVQTFVSSTAMPPLVERAVFTVTEYTVVQWPLNPATPSAAGFGSRAAPCGACSSYHLGVDWNPPAGTPIEAIADGTVVGVNSISGDLGVHVVIEHDIDGQLVRSVYAHMQPGSSPLAVGQSVGFGQLVGRVGNSGLSTGTHLHFAMIDAHGTFIDPIGWMRARVTEPWND